ncbi:MAG: hydrogenase iron-sulfur subunit [Acidimicrobiia bacterium]|nr:hydrogenase iron-sulfur subunit [Acidimicrobiia bacterium]
MSLPAEATALTRPAVLVFSARMISDIGIDLAGSSHMHYSPSVVVIPLPCSSSLRAEWILHAFERGFDGVFVAADGTDCPLVPDCTQRTAAVVGRAQGMMQERGIAPERLKMAAFCSVCAESFVRHMRQFTESLADLAGIAGGA